MEDSNQDRMSADVKQEVMDILHKVWAKLQALPEATPLELGAFIVIILFVLTFLSLNVVSWCHCLCCRKSSYQPSRVQPLERV